jgi:hypothetical protein
MRLPAEPLHMLTAMRIPEAMLVTESDMNFLEGSPQVLPSILKSPLDPSRESQGL